MKLRDDLKLALDRVSFARSLGIVPDPWQLDLLRSGSERVLFNITRQGGKCSMAAIIALHRALYHPQSFTKIATLYRELDQPVAPLAGEGVIPIG